MRPDSSVTTMHGFSRNCTCFDNVRETAYREVLDATRAGKSLSDFLLRLEGVAPEINLHFPEALPLSEIRAIAMSVAKLDLAEILCRAPPCAPVAPWQDRIETLGWARIG
jgi:Primase C terminal 1 (PriCT-1)